MMPCWLAILISCSKCWSCSFGGMALYTYIIKDGDNAQETVHYLVHVHLEDILGHLQAEWHVQKPVPATVGVKGGQV